MRTGPAGAGALGLVMALSGCGSAPSHLEWKASGDTAAKAAYDTCAEEIDARMRLRGYPLHPMPETPQYAYRETVFAQCMRRMGYESD